MPTATELRRIPGAAHRRRRSWRGRGRDLDGPWTHAFGGRGGGRPGRRGSRRWLVAPRRRKRQWSLIALTLGYSAVGLYGANAFWSATRVRVEVTGLPDRATITPGLLADRTARFTVDPDDTVEEATLLLDGRPVPDKALEWRGGTLLWPPGKLAEGRHQVELRVPRAGMPASRHRWSFEVDETPPGIDVPRLLPAAGICDPVTVKGRVEKGSTITLDGKPLELNDDQFTLHYKRPPTGPLHLVATDRAGNQTHAEVIVPVRYAGGQGVHVTAAAWGYEPLRAGILGLIDAGRISVVELDLKDEGGVVGYDSQVPLAREIGAVRPEYRLRETAAALKARGVRVVGRIVAFRDQPLARWAWDHDHRDWVVQTPEGAMHGAYGGFTNFASPEVRRYNLDIALEAAGAGLDDILWDYVRRPEGDPAKIVFPGLQGTPSDGVVHFLAESQAALRERCVHQGASVFGIAADRPDAVGQDIPRIARHVDYVAPMLYPSHWVPGEYRVKNPNAQPYDIVKATLADFQAKTAGTGVHLMPWLQDFSLGHPSGPAEVRAQIDAAADLKVGNWLLWNSGARYTADAIDPARVRRPAGAP